MVSGVYRAGGFYKRILTQVVTKDRNRTKKQHSTKEIKKKKKRKKSCEFP